MFLVCLLAAGLPHYLPLSGNQEEGETVGGIQAGNEIPERGSASALLQSFQNSWERQDLDGMLSSLSERAKIIMKLEFLKLDGEYGKGQAGYIMKDFFERGGGNPFTISRYRELSGGESAYAAGDLTFRDRKSGFERHLRIFISLEESGGKWSIEEVRVNER